MDPAAESLEETVLHGDAGVSCNPRTRA